MLSYNTHCYQRHCQSLAERVRRRAECHQRPRANGVAAVAAVPAARARGGGTKRPLSTSAGSAAPWQGAAVGACGLLSTIIVVCVFMCAMECMGGADIVYSEKEADRKQRMRLRKNCSQLQNAGAVSVCVAPTCGSVCRSVMVRKQACRGVMCTRVISASMAFALA